MRVSLAATCAHGLEWSPRYDNIVGINRHLEMVLNGCGEDHHNCPLDMHLTHLGVTDLSMGAGGKDLDLWIFLEIDGG